MEVLGKLRDVRLEEKGYIISFQVNNIEPSELEKLFTDSQKGLLHLNIKKPTNKRSLEANAFMWEIIGQMAIVLNSSRNEVYEELIQKYGILDREFPVVTMRADIPVSKLEGHWTLLKKSKDGKFCAYKRIRGTSEYNTQEMSYFIDSVINEAKSIGVEIPIISE